MLLQELVGSFVEILIICRSCSNIWDVIHEEGVLLQELVGNFVEILIICRSCSNLLQCKVSPPMDQPTPKVFPSQTIPCAGIPSLMSQPRAAPQSPLLLSAPLSCAAGFSQGCSIRLLGGGCVLSSQTRPPARLCCCWRFHLPLFKPSWLSL